MMIYSNYFSSATKQNGPPNLNAEQFRRMMNIVFIEGILQGVARVKSQEKEEEHRYDLLIYSQNNKLAGLTRNLKPEELMVEMHRLSTH